LPGSREAAPKTVGMGSATTDYPTLETDRLRLRPHRADDFPDSFAMWSEPAVVAFIGGTLSTRQRAWLRVLQYAGHWSLMGFGYWAIEEKSSGRFAGEVGFADFKRDIDARFAALPELGWALPTRFHGKGYATEAARAALAWADERFPRTFCMIDPQNAPSLRVAARCGFEEVERGAYQEQPTIFFERPAASDPL
jgi:RimJ/RimL family protein N-acetyltransferase